MLFYKPVKASENWQGYRGKAIGKIVNYKCFSSTLCYCYINIKLSLLIEIILYKDVNLKNLPKEKIIVVR